MKTTERTLDALMVGKLIFESNFKSYLIMLFFYFHFLSFLHLIFFTVEISSSGECLLDCCDDLAFPFR